MARVEGADAVYEAAVRWREQCLLEDGSIFTAKPLWTLETLHHLVKYFVENLDFGEGDFYTKLEGQLGPAPPEAKQLAAEMFWVMFLFPSSSSMSGATKRVKIKQVWEWSGEPLPNGEFALREALEGGLGNPGVAYHTLRWKEFEFFILMMSSWKMLARDEQAELLQDRWSFADWVENQEKAEARQFRHILLHLLFPETFEPAASGAQKRQLTETFSKRYGLDEIDLTDRVKVDQRIHVIRERAEKEFGEEGASFYEPPFREVWLKSGSGGSGRPPGPDPKKAEKWFAERFNSGTRVWLWAPGKGARKWNEFEAEGLVGIGWDYLTDLRDYPKREAIAEAIMAHRESDAQPTNASLACWQFAQEMSPGDVVIAKKGFRELLGYGVLTSDYEFRESRDEFRHVREIDWKRTGPWTLSKDRKATGKTLTEFTSNKPWLYEAFALMDEGKSLNGDDRGSDSPREGLFISEARFSDILDALARKKNIILQGPPGVGKTFIARRLAWALTGEKGSQRTRVVQFHQSYAYEDFIQGWRPTGAGGFELRPGIFHTFCKAAQDNPDKPHALIIDEINRGNLSRIFGELMMLIEADKRGETFAMPLTYSEDPFYVPENLHLVGTMNTADRSLAMVDYALRRRFAFVDLAPAFGSEAFVGFLDDRGVEESMISRITERMDVLNQSIREDSDLGPGFEIGHSYFCPQEEDEELDEAWYEKIVQSEIAPLLREYWFDRSEKTAQEIERLLP